MRTSCNSQAAKQHITNTNGHASHTSTAWSFKLSSVSCGFIEQCSHFCPHQPTLFFFLSPCTHIEFIMGVIVSLKDTLTRGGGG